MRITMLATAAAALLAAGCTSGNGLEYVPYANALERARAEKKPILINFGGPW